MIERRVLELPGFRPGHRVKPSLDMTKDELNRLSDHDLLVLLHERIKAHDKSHRDATTTFRWTVIAIISALGVIVMAASFLASTGTGTGHG